MRCPFCHGVFTLQGPFCPLCGRRIIGSDADELPEDEEVYPDADSTASALPGTADGIPTAHSSHTFGLPAGTMEEDDGILVVDLEDLSPSAPGPPTASLAGPFAPPSAPASAPPRPGAAAFSSIPGQEPIRVQPVAGDYLGRLCPYCRFPLKKREQMVVCPACRVAHHADCWQENGGCTTYGCRYAPEAHPPQPVQAPRPQMPPGRAPRMPTLPRGIPSPAAATAAASVETGATNAFVLAILGLFSFGLLGVVGALMAAGVLLKMRSLGLRMASAKGKAFGAIILGLGTAAFWALLALAAAGNI